MRIGAERLLEEYGTRVAVADALVEGKNLGYKHAFVSDLIGPLDIQAAEARARLKAEAESRLDPDYQQKRADGMREMIAEIAMVVGEVESDNSTVDAVKRTVNSTMKRALEAEKLLELYGITEAERNGPQLFNVYDLPNGKVKKLIEVRRSSARCYVFQDADDPRGDTVGGSSVPASWTLREEKKLEWIGEKCGIVTAHEPEKGDAPVKVGDRDDCLECEDESCMAVVRVKE